MTESSSTRQEGTIRIVKVFIVCTIIISAGVIVVPYIIQRPEVVIHVLTKFDVSIINAFEDSFLASDYARDNNIVDVEWQTVSTDLWESYVQSGMTDVVWGDLPIIEGLDEQDLLYPLVGSDLHNALSLINDTIGGMTMKGTRETVDFWCATSFSVEIFELLVNESLLQQRGLTTPEDWQDLLSPDLFTLGNETPLIRMSTPNASPIGHRIQHLLTQSLGWKNGIQNLTILYANSALHSNDTDAISSVLQGEGAITPIVYTGGSHTELPLGIQRVHLRDQVVVRPNPIAVASASTQMEHAFGFIQHILSAEVQASWLSETRAMPVLREAFDIASDYSEDVYAEFNWTSRATGVDISELVPDECLVLPYYFDATVVAAYDNLSSCWSTVVEAFRNGTVSEEQMRSYQTAIGEPLAIVDPISHEIMVFNVSYARSISNYLDNETYLDDLNDLWIQAAIQRYQDIMNAGSVLASGLIETTWS